MRAAGLVAALGIATLSLLSFAACGSSGSGSSGSGSGGSDAPGGDDASSDTEGGALIDSAADSGAGGDSGFSDTPSVQFIGRFDDGDALGPRTAWPGSRILARFDGTGVSVKLTQVNGTSGGPAYFNVLVDNAHTQTIAVSGTQTFVLASGLAAGAHTIELEKRTEAPFGTVRFEGYTFTGGTGLLVPLPRLTRRIEFLGDSLIDGFGVDGDRNDPLKCAGGIAPPQYNDTRKSVATKTAQLLSADLHLMAQTDKGISRNADGTSVDTFPIVYARTLPDVAAGAWAFSSYVPDIVVISLGAADFDGSGFPADLQTVYNQLITAMHARYGATTRLMLTVWSQLKAANNVRQTIQATIEAVVAGRPNADKPYNSTFVFPESDPNADETGCQFHANAAHHAAMAALLAAEIRAKTGWQ